jgi:hypothetical protein
VGATPCGWGGEIRTGTSERIVVEGAALSSRLAGLTETIRTE